MSRPIRVGEIVGAFGVRGWVKIRAYTDPPENILTYSPWLIAAEGGIKEYKVIEGRCHGRAVVARLEGISDREQAVRLQKCTISVPRNRFPAPRGGEYYWADLVGLEVYTVSGVPLGTVTDMMETGANNVMEVQGDRQRLIPFVIGEFVKEVRLDQGILVVNWDPEF